MHLRSFKRGKRRYWFVAKSVNNAGRIIQKSVLYVGTADKLYEKLMRLKDNSK